MASVQRPDPDTREKLILTIFANYNGSPTVLSSIPPPPSTHILHTSTLLSPRVLQHVYLITHPSAPQIDHTPTASSTTRHLAEFTDYEQAYSVEIVLQHWGPTPLPPRRPVALTVFDLDSTLIKQEVIDELARSIDVMPAVAAITEQAMQGELDFAESLTARVGLLQGVRADVWEELKERITFADGARELCRALRKLGCKMAVLSGGFVPMAEWVKGELGLDFARANHLLTSAPTAQYPYPHLSGHLDPSQPIVTAALKRSLTHDLACTHGEGQLARVMAVGDGANDLDMLALVGEGGGLGVAYRAKEGVQLKAPNRLNTPTLTDLLYLLGYDESEIADLIAGSENAGNE